MKALDAGAYGVIVPMVNNREEAETAVSACRYPPDGSRSFGPIRAAMYGGRGYASGGEWADRVHRHGGNRRGHREPR